MDRQAQMNVAGAIHDMARFTLQRTIQRVSRLGLAEENVHSEHISNFGFSRNQVD
jgi:hypothetical protein